MGACEGTAEQRATLGRELRRARERAGLSQRALGRLVGRDRSSISRIEATGRTDDAAWWRLADDKTGADGAVVGTWLVVLGAEQGVTLTLAEPSPVVVQENPVPPTLAADEDVTQEPAAPSGAPAPLGDDGCRCTECLARWVKSMNLDRRDATRLLTILVA
ncbi:MAG: helix-turn-helix domain-containing protein, partial [Pseudonocardia sp.]